MEIPHDIFLKKLTPLYGSFKMYSNYTVFECLVTSWGDTFCVQKLIGAMILIAKKYTYDRLD